MKSLNVINTTSTTRLARLRSDDARPGMAADVAASMAAQLRSSLDGEVRFDQGTRALYSTDASNYRQAPLGVVLPRHAQDVAAAVRVARAHGAPVVSRGGGTGLAGQSCNTALLMDFSKYMRDVVDIDVEQRRAIVQPGCVLDRLLDAARPRGLAFGPDPATHDRCTIGGMLGNNSCGSHSLLSTNAGLGLRTSDNTHALEVLLYDGTTLRVSATPPAELDAIIRGGGRRGEIYGALRDLVERYGDVIRSHMPKLGRRVSGYNLDDLLPENGFHVARALVGSESTLVTILEATLHLVPNPAARSLVVLGFEDISVAAECALDVLEFKPIACEAIDQLLLDYVRRRSNADAKLAILPEGRAYLIVELGADSRQASEEQARRMMAHVSGLARRAPVDMKLYGDSAQAHLIWRLRESALASTTWVPGQRDTWPGWEDSAVPVDVVHHYLRELRQLFHRHGYEPSLYGHIGQGCVHCRVQFDLYTTPGIQKYQRFLGQALSLVKKFGGVASGEHGDGQARGQLWQQMFSPELVQAFTAFKRIWDPDNRMNPGRLIDLESRVSDPTEHLRLGTDYRPPALDTHFSFPEDQHDFSRAALRCVGVGACRRENGGTMCPSYMVTRDEQHSTRGRSRLLFEMLNGELVRDGWRSEAVKGALDLCLACKGCKSDCPVNVDMATYKAEFFSHYYQGRLRPRHAYAFGWIHTWSRLAAHAPRLINGIAQSQGLGSAAKWLAGVHAQRSLPEFAPRTFRQWFRERPVVNGGAPEVVLFPDTFNDHFHPEVAIAATQVLEHAGFRVYLPPGDVCCGRPLYDYGFLTLARRRWVGLLDTLRPWFRAGAPLVVLEPSCWAAFRDELVNLLPSDPDARRLRDVTHTLASFLRDRAPEYRPPALRRAALVHGHCHQKALDALEQGQAGALSSERALFDQLELRHREPETGCCGMAGAFGYERGGEHYAVSVACGERALLPAVRDVAADELVIADGFSCREQIRQQTGRGALHTAQVLQLALQGAAAVTQSRGQLEWLAARARRRGTARALLAVGIGGLAALAYRGWQHRRAPRLPGLVRRVF